MDKKSRKEDIAGAIAKLEELKHDPDYQDSQYAIDENIIFLKSIRTLPGYIWWLLSRVKKIDGTRLLELTDFPVPEWDVKMHERLIEMQRREKPGLIEPLVSAIVEFIKSQKRDLVIANLGAGGMEVDRQVIERLMGQNYPYRLTILGVDKSATTREIAKKNLEPLSIYFNIYEASHATAAEVKRLISYSNRKVNVILCHNDIFDLERDFPPKYFDLVYHSLFKHHLTASDQERLDIEISKISNRAFEFDGYRHLSITPIQTIVGWNYPGFLNAEIFSNLRFNQKNRIINTSGQNSPPVFYNIIGAYLIKK